MPPSLNVLPLRFEFRAVDSVRIPPGKAGNVFRGGFGSVLRQLACTADCPGPRDCARAPECAYAILFEPRAPNAPSGFATPPRPFVIRAPGLDGRTFAPGEPFSIAVHLFGDPLPDAAGWIRRVFERLAEAGIGAARGRAQLTTALTGSHVVLAIEPEPAATHWLAIDFLTPTDLKAGGAAQAAPDFHTLFARARDRISSLMALYGTGAPDVDYRALGEAARSIRTLSATVRQVSAGRRSSRTGQTHDIGGFVGRMEYQGNTGAFLPWLKAAYWTGVGRHTVWGNGVIRITENP